MTYNALVEMANSISLRDRVMAAAAEQDVVNPYQWTVDKMWAFAASPSWADKWTYAQNALTINQQPDLGLRDDVITDGDIRAAVQAMLAP